MHMDDLLKLVLPALGAAAVLVGWGASAGSAQTGNLPTPLTVAVVDRATGKPLPGAALRTYVGVVHTDSIGRARLQIARRPDTIHLSVHCPVTRVFWTGRAVEVRDVALAMRDTAITIAVDAAGCEEPPLRTVTGEFSGHYTAGFEASEFIPCQPFADLSRTAYAELRDAAWLQFSFDPSQLQWPESGRRRRDTAGNTYEQYYVRVRGTLVGPGMYGHLGSSLYELTAERVLELRAAGSTDCPEPPDRHVSTR